MNTSAVERGKGVLERKERTRAKTGANYDEETKLGLKRRQRTTEIEKWCQRSLKKKRLL